MRPFVIFPLKGCNGNEKCLLIIGGDINAYEVEDKRPDYIPDDEWSCDP